MPSRVFKIHVINNTGSPLNRIKDDFHLHGAFTGGWDPPDRINPGEVRAFQAESDGLFQGTDGHVTYEIADGSTVADRFKIHWNNPFWGVTDSDPETLISTGVFFDRAPGESPRYLFEGGGRRPLGTDPGPIITTGWTEIMPGLVALPVPMLGIEAHAWSAFRLSDRPGASVEVPSFGQSAPVPKLSFTPRTSAPPSGWNGTWVFPGDGANAQLRILITADPRPSNPALSTLHGFTTFTVNIQERSPRAGDAPLTLAESGVRVEDGSAMRYLGNTWPPRRSLLRVGGWQSMSAGVLSNIAAASATSAGNAMRSAQRGFPSVNTAVARARTADSAMSESGEWLASQPLQFADRSISRTVSDAMVRVTDAADCLMLTSARITLLLYAVHSETGQPLGHAVRYLRLGPGGETVADVMTLPEFRGPN